MEYVLKSTGEIVTAKMVEINGVKHPRQAFKDLPELLPRKEWPTIDQATQVIEPIAGHEVDGEWVNFAVRDKNAAELAQDVLAKRENEYPSIGDQLDSLFHAGVFPADMATQIQAVKDNNPKG